MKKLTTIVILSVMILSSCGGAETIAPTTENKKPFFVETRILGKKTESYTIEKSARLTAGSTLTLAAESVGEVSLISAKEGSKIKRGTKLISLRDTVNSYDIRVAQAQNNVTIQDATIESTRVNLDQSVKNAETAYEQAKRTYDTLVSKTALTADTLANTNAKTLESYNETYRTYISSIESTMTNFLYEGDKILGMTTAFQYTNDGWEPYLGTRIGNVMAEAKDHWNKVYSMRGDVRAKKESGGNISALTIQSDLDIITKAYAETQAYVDSMILMIQNNIVGGGLSQAMQDGWVLTWNGIKSQIQSSEAGFNSWKGQTLTFFQNYQNTEIATRLAVESLSRDLTQAERTLLEKSKDMKLTYETTRIDLSDRISGAKLALDQTKNAREAAIKARNATITQLGASRQSGILSLEQAQREYAKLTVTAPFDGTVTRVIASLGQRVNPGTPLIEVISNTPEVLIDLDASIADALTIGDSVSVKIDDASYSGVVSAVSRAAGQNLLYTTRISVPDARASLGSAATVTFRASREVSAMQSESIILPLRSVKIISEQEGEIALISRSGSLVRQSVKLGRIIGDGVYIEDLLANDIEIILSDVSNFDPTKFTLDRKNK